MGTRNLTIVVHQGETQVAQYCQWDGYPSGQGITVLEFLRDKFSREKFINRLANNTYTATEDQHAALWQEVIGSELTEWVNMADSKKFGLAYPSLVRDIGGHILEFIQDGEYTVDGWDFADSKGTRTSNVVKATDKIPLHDSSAFIKDGLFCEWAYKVDLDANTLTVLESGNNPVKVYELSALPSNEQFLADLEGEEVDE